MLGNHEKLNLKFFSFSPYVLIVGVILSFSVGITLLGAFSQYQTDVSVLVIPKSPAMAAQGEEILANLEDIFSRLSFFERVLVDGKIERPCLDCTQDELKALWNRNSQMARNDGSLILTLSVFDPSRANSQKIAKQAVASLLATVSQYYNIKTEVDFRIVADPETRSTVRNWPLLVGVSTLLGFVLAFCLIFIFSTFALKISGKKGKEENKLSASLLKFPKLDFTAKNEINPFFQGLRDKKSVAPANLPIAPEKHHSIERTHFSVPANLPMADEIIASEGAPKHETEVLFQESSQLYDSPVFSRVENVISEATATSPEKTGEPTEEEYRRRLNALLKGGF